MNKNKHYRLVRTGVQVQITNALRILEAAGVPFAVHEYDASDSQISAVAAADYEVANGAR